MPFDGIDEVVLPLGNLGQLRDFYVETMGFDVAVDETDPDSRLAKVWSLPTAPRRTLLLVKPGSAGGSIRLVETPGLEAPGPAGRPDRSGAYALDFFLRDAVGTERRIEKAGYPFRGPAARYPLPGHPETSVHERILDQPHSGVIHATIGYRDKGTRCVLNQDDQQQVSEVVAVVFCSQRYAEAVAFVAEVLGGTAYLRGEFGGPELESLLHLERGEVLPMTLFRGAGSRNARLEICAARAQQPAREDEAVPRATAICRIKDLDRVAAALADGRHGRTTGPLDVRQDGTMTRRLGVRTLHGLSLDLVQQD